jgi:predicted RNA binding protein YcfA (HicA-like mRNA interferase family)
MAAKYNKVERAFMKCSTAEDFAKFAGSQGAIIRHKGHWVIRHPNGNFTTIASTPGKKIKLHKTRTEIAENYKLDYLLNKNYR